MINMKTKAIILNVLILIFFGPTVLAQTAAVANLSTEGVGLTPEIAGKITRIELVKTQKFTVLDQFDMESALSGKGNFNDCYGKNCLIEMGQALKADYIFSGSIDALGNKIIVSLKMIDVKASSLKKTHTLEFDDQPNEISRMVEITLLEMLDMPINAETKKRLEFKHEVITSSNVGRVNNSGPRFGLSVVAGGDMFDFFTRPEDKGGLDILPGMTNIGYQFEAQYIGTENFSALFEIIPNIAGMEQGQFIPTLSLLNGFRFGQSGWEFAFGPSFGGRRMINGLNDPETGDYYTESEWFEKDFNEWSADPSHVDQTTGEWLEQYSAPSKDLYTKRLDSRGYMEFNTNWIMGLGRTFKSGALNIPLNLYYSGNKHGHVIGASVGFNITKQKKNINQTF